MIVYCLFRLLDEGADQLLAIYESFDDAAQAASKDRGYYFTENEVIGESK